MDFLNLIIDAAMKFLWTVFAILLAFCALDIEASVFAKSTKTECALHGEEGTDLKTKDGNPCKQKLVVALTITGNEVSLMNISRNNFYNSSPIKTGKGSGY